MCGSIVSNTACPHGRPGVCRAFSPTLLRALRILFLLSPPALEQRAPLPLRPVPSLPFPPKSPPLSHFYRHVISYLMVLYRQIIFYLTVWFRNITTSIFYSYILSVNQTCAIGTGPYRQIICYLTVWYHNITTSIFYS
jgi:hypothetical protein